MYNINITFCLFLIFFYECNTIMHLIAFLVIMFK